MISEAPQPPCPEQALEDWIEQQLAGVDKQIRQLMEVEAQQIISSYWAYKKTANSKKPHSQKSKLNPRLKVSKDQQHYAVEWQVYTPAPHRANSSYAINLTKSRSQQSYTEREIKKWAKPWELNHVLQVEESLTKIRQQYALLLQIRKNLNTLLKTRKEFLVLS